MQYFDNSNKGKKNVYQELYFTYLGWSLIKSGTINYHSSEENQSNQN
jgi:hypothetical protein